MLMVRQLAYHLALKMLHSMHQDSGEFIFQQDCHSSQNTFYDLNISQGSVATHLKWGGIFNDRFIANFLENVTVKKFSNRPVFDEVMCKLRWLTFFGPPCMTH